MIVKIIHHAVVHHQKIVLHHHIVHVIEVVIMNMNDQEMIENHQEIEMINMNVIHESKFSFFFNSRFSFYFIY